MNAPPTRTHDESRALEAAVREAYSAAARRPQDDHPFPVGRKFAQSIGYPAELLDTLPELAVDAFAGVANLSVLAPIASGSRVLDLGCGAAMDSLIAAQRTGPKGFVVGLDFSAPMLERARQAAAAAGAANVGVCLANAGTMPFRDGAFDVALVNGIFNLNPARELIFGELARVIRPGGFVYAAELVVGQSLPAESGTNIRSWFA